MASSGLARFDIQAGGQTALPDAPVQRGRFWGRCWHQRDYYCPYGDYRRYDDDEWRERYRYRPSYGY